jgi:UDPglucose 6-dehydrogenase
MNSNTTYAGNVSVVGLGKLGLCLAAVMADRGYQTVGIDVDEGVVNAVNAGKSPLVEPGLNEIIGRHGGTRLRASTDHVEAMRHSDVTFVLVATPSNPDGTFSNRYVESALRSLATEFGRSGKTYHNFVVSSTVRPGSIRGSFIPLLEQHSGRRLNHDFGVCYDPDFVALGEVVKGFLQPDLVILGESDPRAGEQVATIHDKICTNRPAVARMSLISAEIAKVSLNTYITMKISFANMLANLCERIPGADVDAVTAGIGADRRISPHYFRAGLAFGGTCFPRDTAAFIALAEEFKVDSGLVRDLQRINDYQNRRLAEIVLERTPRSNGNRVGILGLSFKARTAVITESPMIKLIEALLKYDLQITVYDPLAMNAARAVFEDQIECVSSADRCIEVSSTCVIGNREQEYKAAAEAYRGSAAKTMIDCWRILDSGKLATSVNYVPWGFANQSALGAAR